jgi:hypothetical protein
MLLPIPDLARRQQTEVIAERQPDLFVSRGGEELLTTTFTLIDPQACDRERVQLPVVSHLRFVGNSTLRYCNLTTNDAPSWIRPGVGLNGRIVFIHRKDSQL